MFTRNYNNILNISNTDGDELLPRYLFEEQVLPRTMTTAVVLLAVANLGAYVNGWHMIHVCFVSMFTLPLVYRFLNKDTIDPKGIHDTSSGTVQRVLPIRTLTRSPIVNTHR